MVTLVRTGDWLVLGAGLALCFGLAATLWRPGMGEAVVVRSGGKIFAELPLRANRTLSVPGPLGISQVRIENGRVRVAADPSPRQYCVKQGWLSQPGEIAICLPNQTSVEITGRAARYDSLNY
jgi:hypothetical protein